MMSHTWSAQMPHYKPLPKQNFEGLFDQKVAFESFKLVFLFGSLG